jgi:hypothetical protein
VRDTTDLVLEIIESVLLFLARPGQEAEQRQLTSVVTPLLNHAEGYFVQLVDLVPEMTQGSAGLLDDSCLVLRILQNLDRGPDYFMDWDLGHPIELLRRLVGKEVARNLDAHSTGCHARDCVRHRPVPGRGFPPGLRTGLPGSLPQPRRGLLTRLS